MRRTLLQSDPTKVRAWRERSRQPRVNAARSAKKRQAYAAVLRSAFHRQLRYLAWERAGGLCECAACVAIRRGTVTALTPAERMAAWTPIPVWFVAGGGEPWQRFRSVDGQLHHEGYRYFGEENPAELSVVRWMWQACHARIETGHKTRRRYLLAAVAAGGE